MPQVVFSWEQEACPRCAAPFQVRLTRRRLVHSIRYGTFLAVERQGYCPQHRELAPARCEQLARLVAPGSKHAYDVLVRIGMARFLECRQDELCQIVAETKRDRRIFERFRSALRICPRGGKRRRNDEGAPRELSAKCHRRVLQNLHTSLTRQVRRGTGSARACKIVVQHLVKYGKYLFGHTLRKKGVKIVVPRTNNDQEGLFRTVKRQCRRLHGRKDLSNDLETAPPALPLLLNLTNRDYCETVYRGSEPEQIADRFSRVDPEGPAELLKSWRQEKISQRMPRTLEKLKPSQAIGRVYLHRHAGAS